MKLASHWKVSLLHVKKFSDHCDYLQFISVYRHAQTMSISDSYNEATKNVASLFKNDPGPTSLTYEEALARGIRYNYDYRIKLVNAALQSGQLSIAEYTMFPDIKTTSSLYTRNNDYATFGITAQGQPTAC